MIVWVVGETIRGQAWLMQGLFSSEDKAIARCQSARNANFFVAPVTLDATLPDEEAVWPGAYYPERT